MTKQAIIAASLATLAILAVAVLPGANAMKTPETDLGGGGGGGGLPADIKVQGAGVLVGTVVGAVGGAGTDSCSGDPCATTQCSPGSASAAAGGSELATADARVGEDHASQSQPGAAAAKAQGTGAASASAKGERAWSWKEANSSCSKGTTATASASVDALALGCVADDAIQATESFTGRLFQDPSGNVVAVDEASGLGLAVPSLLTVGGATLRSLAPVDGSGLTALDAVLSIDLVNGEDALGCSVALA